MTSATTNSTIFSMLMNWMSACFVCVMIRIASADGCCKLELSMTYNLTDSEILLEVMASLEWRSVTIIYEDNTDTFETINTIVPALHRRGVQTCDTKGMPTNGSTNICLPSNVNNFFLLGSFIFLRQFFEQIPMIAEQRGSSRSAFLFISQWMTIINEQDVSKFRHLATAFQNFAVIVRSQTNCMSLWTVLHVRGDSELSFVSTLPTSAPPLTRDRILPNLSYGLGGRTLTVVAKSHYYFLFETNSTNGTSHHGQLMDLLNHLAGGANFSYKLIPPPNDDSWGQELENGQWNGPIGVISRKEADMALGPFTVTQGRTLVADPVTFMYDQLVVIIHLKKQGTGLTFYLQPFQTHVYLVISGSLAAVVLFLFVLERCRWVCCADRLKVEEAGGSSWEWLMINVFVLVEALLSKPTEHKRGSRVSRVLLVTWMLMSVVVASLYSSQLTSSLTVGKHALPFTSLAQLLKQDTYTWGVTGGTAEETFLKTTTNKELQEFYAKLETFAKADPTVLGGYEVQRLNVLRENYASFTLVAQSFEPWSARNCNIYKLPEVYMTLPVAVFLQKNSPYHDIISKQVGDMIDLGLIDYWKRKWMPEKRQCDPNEGQSSREIGLDDTQTAFYLAALGLGMAVIVLGIERVCHVKKHNPSRAAKA